MSDPSLSAHACALRVRPLLPVLAVAAVACCALAAIQGQSDMLVPSTAGSGLAVVMLHLALVWGRPRELAITAGVCVLGAVGWVGARLSTGWLPGVQDTAGAGGIALLLFLTYRGLRRVHPDAEAARDVASLGAVYPLLAVVGLTVAFATIPLLPRAWDARAYVLDTAFPWHSFHVGRWLAGAPTVAALARVDYDGIFFLVPALVALRLRLARESATDLLLGTVVVSLAGQIGYYVTPVIGPVFAFAARFPDTLPNMANLPHGAALVPPELRNGMPSLHTAWALVFAWCTRPFHAAVRGLGLAVVALMVVATLGFGYHYVIDLVAAVPFAAAAQASVTRVPDAKRRERLGVIAGSVALAGVWIVAPRVTPDPSGAFRWVVVAAAVLTVALGLLAEHRVARAAGEPSLLRRSLA